MDGCGVRMLARWMEKAPRRLTRLGLVQTSSLERMSGLYRSMVDAVVCGEGLGRVAELAAAAAGVPVVIALPAMECFVVSPEGALSRDQTQVMQRHVSERMRGRLEDPPGFVAEEAVVSQGGRTLGLVAALEATEAEFLQLAAVAALVDVALEETKEQAGQALHDAFLEDLARAGELDADDVVRRGRRLGTDLAHGAFALCAELQTSRPRQLMAFVAGEWPGAIAQQVGERMHALLPLAPGDSTGADEALERARRLAERLRSHGAVGISSFYAGPAEYGRALQEAELVLDVVLQSGEGMVENMGSSSYRLLFRVLVSHPEEVKAFYEDTIGPVVRYDAEYRTDLVNTLETYLGNDCNMNATAAAIFAHRHTVAYRLDRVKDLTGLHPARSEDRERLGLGLKAFRIIEPRLPR
jgi:sugar diacid utilization regulator